MVEDVVKMLKTRFGEEWPADDEANLRFTIEVELLVREVDGVHLIGDPEVVDGQINMTCWLDNPIDDLFHADQIAYEIFGRISEQFFWTERQFEKGGMRYPFVTGSDRHGHVGALIFAGPHAADFASRHQMRLTGDVRFHA